MTVPGKAGIPGVGRTSGRRIDERFDHCACIATAWCENDPMVNQYTGVFEQVGDWWTGFVEELPGCNVQERSLGEARESLKAAIHDVLGANRELSRREAAGHQVVRESVTVPVERSARTSCATRLRTGASCCGRAGGTRSTGIRPPVARAPCRGVPRL